MNAEIMKALEQVQRMQEEVDNAEKSLGSLTASAESGGGMVKVVANGFGDLVSIKLEKEVVDPADPEMLEDLIIAATNSAIGKARSQAEQKMNSVRDKYMPDLPGLTS
ncbi:MAG: YbaB/EbfC family nucleoid-associated protein [bacterium]